METAAKHNLNELGYFDGTSKMSFLEGLASYQRVIKDKKDSDLAFYSPFIKNGGGARIKLFEVPLNEKK